MEQKYSESTLDAIPMVAGSLPLSEERKSVDGLRAVEAENIARIRDSIQVLVKLGSFYGFDGKQDVDNSVRSWFRLTESIPGALKNSSWMKTAKYKLAAFFAFHTKNSLPKSPFGLTDHPNILIGGRFDRWLQLTFKRQPEEKLGILTSLLQAKKGMPRPSKEVVYEKTKEAFVKLTTPKQTEQSRSAYSWIELDEIESTETKHGTVIKDSDVSYGINRFNLEHEIRRTVREIFDAKEPARNRNGRIIEPGRRAVKFEMKDRITPFFPSTSANYINTRYLGGAVGTLLAWDEFQKYRRKGGYLQKSGTIQVPKKSILPNVDEKELEAFRRWPHLFPEHGGRQSANTFRDSEEKIERSQTLDSESLSELEHVWKRVWISLLNKAQTEENSAELVGLAEALKVRVITKGPPFRQMVLRALWKKIHSTLRGHPCFKLIGEPVTPAYLLDRLGRELYEGEIYLSGDYEDSTNNIHSWASLAAADELSKILRLLPVERELFFDSLTRHKIVLKEEDGPHIGEVGPQETGQLMGSITSFPILCLINAAMGRWAIELSTHRKITLKEAHLVINGDDILMRCLKEAYSFWQKIAKLSGMTESVGKTYVSREFANINSTNFSYSTNDMSSVYSESIIPVNGEPTYRRSYRACPFRQVPFINMGLVLGLKRSQGKVGLGDQLDPMNTIGARYRSVLEACPEKIREDVHREFIKNNSIEKIRLPWFIPEWLGGLGLLYEGTPHRPSRLDLQIAARILRNWKTIRPRSISRAVKTWKVWTKATEKWPPKSFTFTQMEPGVEERQENLAVVCVDLLLDSSNKIEDLFDPDVKAEVGKLIRANEKLWEPKGKEFPPPLSFEKIGFQPIFESDTFDLIMPKFETHTAIAEFAPELD